MRGVVVGKPGGPEALVIERDLDRPVPEPHEVVIRVAATSINRADIIQRQGQYAPPPGASPVLGLECSGWVDAVGGDVSHWSVGDRVCALLPGGGYADYVSVDAGHVLAVPESLSLPEAATLPEAACTVWSSLVWAGGLAKGDRCLIHGGTGGIGTLGVQVAYHLGAWVATTGSATKLDTCRKLGANLVIDYRGEDFQTHFSKEDDKVDVVLDNIGGPYLAANGAVLASDGRLVIIGVQGGSVGEIDLRPLIRKRASIHLVSLRGRSAEEKRRLVAEVADHVVPAVASGDITPVIDSTFDLEDVVAAHEHFDSGAHTGNVVIVTGAEA